MNKKFYHWTFVAFLFVTTAVVSFGQVPVNDLCANAIPITCAGTITGTTINATSDNTAPSCGGGGTPNNGVWYTITGTGGTITVNTCLLAGYDTKLHVYEGDCSNLICITGNDDFCGLQSSVTWNSTLGVTYYLIVNGFGAATGNFTLQVTMADVFAPTFTNCNANIVENSDPGLCGAVVTFPTPFATDNCGTSSVDQQALTNNTCMAFFSQTDLAQSFIPSQSCISGASVFITSGTGSGNVTIQLYTNLPNAGGVLLASGTDLNVNPGEWADVTWPNVNVIPGNTYYLVFTSTNVNLCIAGDLNNGYPFGNVFANTGYSSFPNYDYTFKTQSCLSANVTQIAGLPSGSLFPVGVTNMVFVAQDGNGNSDTCSFTVTVNDVQAPIPNAGPIDNGTFNTGNISVAITDYNTSYAPLTVSGLPSLYLANSIDSVCIDITHTWTSDLDIYLVSPLGTEYELSTDNGGSGDNYTSTCFKMSATTPIISGIAPFTGTYIPEGIGGFDVFVGENPNGTWQLKVYDDAGGDVGTINYFYMSFTITDISVLPDVTGECVTLTIPTASDNCLGTVTATTSDPTTYNTDGTYTVTWVYNDGNGNTSTQQQVVIVDDTTAPVPSVASLSPITVCADITITNFPTAIDNCVGLINATTTDPLTYSSLGSYTINWTYNDGNGNTASQTQTVNVVDCSGLEDYSLIVNAQVYPNPNNGQFTLSLSELPKGNTYVRVITTLGQVVYSTNLTAPIMTFDLSSLAAATYYLQIVAEDGVVTKQMIVRQ